MAEYNSYFDEPQLLSEGTSYVKKEDHSGLFMELLAAFAPPKCLVLAHCVNELKFGRYEQGVFHFADGKSIDEKYVMEIRLFNDNTEILLQKNGSIFKARCIKESLKDNPSEGYEEHDYVDCASPLFGKRDKDISPDFVHLTEKGRKIHITIPVDKTADYYKLKTRSYIGYDSETGQAGYVFWRYLGLEDYEKGEF